MGDWVDGCGLQRHCHCLAPFRQVDFDDALWHTTPPPCGRAWNLGQVVEMGGLPCCEFGGWVTGWMGVGCKGTATALPPLGTSILMVPLWHTTCPHASEGRGVGGATGSSWGDRGAGQLPFQLVWVGGMGLAPGCHCQPPFTWPIVHAAFGKPVYMLMRVVGKSSQLVWGRPAVRCSGCKRVGGW
jgi:hypothetical protein